MSYFFSFPLKVIKEFKKDHAPQLAASLAYYAVFSLGPLILLLTSVLGFFLKSQEVQMSILSFFEENIGSQSAQIIGSMIQRVGSQEGSFWANAIGIIILVFASTKLFNQLQYAMNVIWDVRLKPRAGIKVIFRKRLLSFALILIIGLLIFASLFISTALSIGIQFLSQVFPFLSYLLPLAELLLSLGIMSLLFMMVFRYLPDVKLKWKYVWRGGLITGALFFIGKLALSWYFTSGGVLSSYGVAGSFIAILMWVYYSSLILLFGAEFTQVWLREKKIKITPQPIAHSVKKTMNIHLFPQVSLFKRMVVGWSILKTQLRMARFLLKTKKRLKEWRKKLFSKKSN